MNSSIMCEGTFVLQEGDEVSTETSDKLENDLGSGGLQSEGFGDGTCQFILIEAQCNLALLLHQRNILAEERRKLFGQLAGLDVECVLQSGVCESER